MKVAIDSSVLESGHAIRGVGVNTRELIDALLKYSKNTKVEIYPVDFAKTDLSQYDLAHYPYFHPFFNTLPDAFPTKSLVTVHDAIQLIYPKQYPPGLKGQACFRKQKKRLHKADGILTISETSRKDIVRLLGAESKKIYTVYLAANERFKKINSKTRLSQTAKKYNLPKKFILYVGDVNYQKNIITLVEACSESNIPLVLVGKQAKELETLAGRIQSIKGPRDAVRFLSGKSHPEEAHYKKVIDSIQKNGAVSRLGFVPDDELVDVYNLATIYCQPSLYEGFGLPLIESFACGTPVVAARTQALVEVGSDAALYFDPQSVNELADVLKNTLKNHKLSKELISKGFKRAKDFSWEKCAKETLNVYTTILENNKK